MERVKRKNVWTSLFVAFMTLQIVSYFLNSDQYLQLPGMYIFLFCALAVGFLWTILNIWRKPIRFHQGAVLVILASMAVSAIVNYSVLESGYLLSYLFLMFMTFLFCSMALSEGDLKKIGGAYVILAAIISLLIIVFHKRFYADESNRITIQLGSNPLIDPNYLGACLVGPSFLSLKAAMSEKKWRKLNWLLTALIVVGMFMTGSRGALVAWAVGVFIIACEKFFKNFSRQKLGFLIIVGALGVVAALVVIPPAYLERMFDINTWIDASNLRRFELWKNALDMIFKRPFFGYGLGNTVETIGNAAHNSYLEFCAHFGLIGGITLIVLFFRLIFKKGNVFMRALALSTAVWAIFISAEATMFFWLNMSLCILSERIEREKEGELKNE